MSDFPGRGNVLDQQGKYIGSQAEVDVSVLSLADGQSRKFPVKPPGATYSAAAFSPDSKLFVVARSDKEGGIWVWDLEANTARLLESSKGWILYSLTFAKDGSLFSGDPEGRVMRWNLQDGSSTVIYQSKFPKHFVASLKLVRDDRVLLAVDGSNEVGESYEGEVTLIDLENQASRRIASHGSQVAYLLIDAAESFLVTGSNDGTFRVGPISGEEPHVIAMPEVLDSFAPPVTAISPDGRWIAVRCMNDASELVSCLVRKPEGPLLHTLPREQLLARLRSLTNLRVVPDKSSRTEYRLDTLPFPGWEKPPTW